MAVNPKLEPEYPNRTVYTEDEQNIYEKDVREHKQDHSEWQKNCNPVENIGTLSTFPDGHPCETTETKPYIVTKLY